MKLLASLSRHGYGCIRYLPIKVSSQSLSTTTVEAKTYSNATRFSMTLDNEPLNHHAFLHLVPLMTYMVMIVRIIRSLQGMQFALQTAHLVFVGDFVSRITMQVFRAHYSNRQICDSIVMPGASSACQVQVQLSTNLASLLSQGCDFMYSPA